MKMMTRREAIKLGGRFIFGVAISGTASPLLHGCHSKNPGSAPVQNYMQEMQAAKLELIKITILYDNNSWDKNLKADWGFSCLIEGLDKTILFDTGRYDSIFLSNITKLRVDTQEVEIVFLSHEHKDHIGGLRDFLILRSDVIVYLLKSFSSAIKSEIKEAGARIGEVTIPRRITSDTVSIGELKSYKINEQSLLINTEKGVIVITGCAHPGIIEIVENAKKITGQEILFVLGGFHLRDTWNIRNIVSQLQKMGVRYIAPTHCSGKRARLQFAKSFGPNYINVGVGRIIRGRDLLG